MGDEIPARGRARCDQCGGTDDSGVNMAYKKISDYAAIGNGHTIALVGLDGALDWM
jgi:hypothetical protein